MDFYINVTQHFDDLLITAIEDGKRKRYKLQYRPYLFVPDPKGDYLTLEGKKVGKFEFDSHTEWRNYVYSHENYDKKFWGLHSWSYLWIYDNYPEKINYDLKLINIGSIDIETDSADGFGNVDIADKVVTAITLSKLHSNKKVTLGYGNYSGKDTHYIKCSDERDLLLKFITIWKKFDFDVVTGWNSEGYDIPYMHNRIKRILGDEHARQMSPWGIVEDLTLNNIFKTKVKRIAGIAQLDYLALYKKFSYTPQESYKLDHVAESELGIKKVDYSEYGSLNKLYQNDHEKFIRYNVHDVTLVDGLEQKMKLIELAISIAYTARINYVDSLTTVRLWDILIHNYLRDRNIVIPSNFRHKEEDENVSSVPGGHVKAPEPKYHKWIMTYDFTSLYPKLVIQFNISPETLRGRISVSTEQILNNELTQIYDTLVKDDLSIAGSGCIFSRKKQGFIPALMDKLFSQRVVWKDKMLAEESSLEKEKDPVKKGVIEYLISEAKNQQQAIKIIANGGYGALANQYNRWFSVDLAESITLSGQVAIQVVERKVNKYFNKLMKTTDIDYICAIDTDSVHVTFETWVEQNCKDKTDSEICEILNNFSKANVEPEITRILKDFAQYVNAYTPAISMKREVIANRALWTTKKHYAMSLMDKEGTRYAKPKMKFVGLECVKSSTPIKCRDQMKKSIEIILLGDQKQLLDQVSAFKKEFTLLPFEEIASPRTANNISEWADDFTICKKGTPMHIRGVLLFNHWLKISKITTIPKILSGEKIRFMYLKDPNPMNCHVIAVPGYLPKEFDITQYIDYHRQYEKVFKDPIEKLATIRGWVIENQDTIMDLFS